MSEFWSRCTKSLSPYVAGEQPRDRRFIKLNTNEHPYPPSPLVADAILQKLGGNGEILRLYPDPSCAGFREAVSDYTQKPANQLFVSNGSDELLAFACMAFFDPGRPVLFPDITYSFYPVYMGLFGLDYRTLPLDESFHIRISDYDTPDAGGILLSNPNAPTAIPLPLCDVERLAQILLPLKRVLVVDEAYAEFGAQSALSLVDQYPNVLLIHTLSKDRALAGMRLSYAVGQPELIDALERVRDSFNSYTLDHLAQAAGEAAMRDVAYYKNANDTVCATRDWFVNRLDKLGFDTLPSGANFIFTRHPALTGIGIFTKLRENGILVRHFAKPRIYDFVRITIGTREDMETVAAAMEALL